MKGAWLRRWKFLIIASAVACGLSALAIANVLPDRYTAEAIVIVPTSAAGSAGEAANLATTYADLIPEDRAIMRTVGLKIGRTPDEVRANASVTHDFATAIMRLSLSDADPQVAILGARTLAASVVGPKPVSPRIAPNSLAVVHMPDYVATQAMSPIQVAILGAILGIALAIVLIVAWERSEGRIDDVQTLSEEAGCAASSLAHASSQSMVALMRRWIDMGGTRPVRVVLFPVSPASEAAAEATAERLRRDRYLDELRTAHVADSKPRSKELMTIEVGDTPGGESAAEALALTADVNVLVVTKGTRLSDLRETITVLEQFGAAPSWALLAHPQRVREDGATVPAEKAVELPLARQRPN